MMPLGAGMAEFHWEESMSVGVSVLDVDHRKLVDILAHLQDSMGEAGNRQVIATTIDTLLDYSIEHFRHEEEAMHRHGYPDVQRHEEEHAALMERLREFKRNADDGHVASVIELMDFLGGYLTNHMLHSDKKLGNFLRMRSVS